MVQTSSTSPIPRRRKYAARTALHVRRETNVCDVSVIYFRQSHGVARRDNSHVTAKCCEKNVLTPAETLTNFFNRAQIWWRNHPWNQ